ncbi:SANT domain-containing protein 2 [Gossypium australe]|uniref:SANT domain-containing protein 2 n=1 Tax=Gossypium australe TaxID=47621 RepID=A0A5B6V5C3_9ROSI|nr:SANT domain-containing protein 2 [Gossypium australe]
MATTFSPGRSPGGSRLQLGAGSGVSRLRSSSLKKPPEPLRRAVADCLSSSSPAAVAGGVSSHHQGGPLILTEASRTLRDYLAAPSTTDQAYIVILEHTIAERERSPALVGRCVALLKRYLLRYKPSEETLQQIDQFCVNLIAECDISLNRQLPPWSRSLNQQSISSTTSTSSASASPLLPVSSFASAALVKSLNYVRSLLAKHIPKRSFQPAAFAGATLASRQSLPTLSSMLSRSFNSQLCPVNGGESSEKKDATNLSVSNLSNVEEADGIENPEYLAHDVLKWRWLGDHPSSLLYSESHEYVLAIDICSFMCSFASKTNLTLEKSVSKNSDRSVNIQDMRTHNFVQVGAAALLVGDMEAKMKGQPWKYFGTADMPYLDQLIQPSSVTTITNSAAAHSHLRAITALKRSKGGPRQIWHALHFSQIIAVTALFLLHFNGWDDSPASMFRPRARPLFQYRHYSEQQPLQLNPAEVSEVIAAVCSETSSRSANTLTVSSRLSYNSGKQSMDVAVSVLIKLVIDIMEAVVENSVFRYVLDSGVAAPLTLSMLEEMLSSPRAACRVRAFDLIINLGVHAHLLEPMVNDDKSAIKEEYAQELLLNGEDQFTMQGIRKIDSAKKLGTSSAIDKFESWILNILYEILLLLVQTVEKEESVWASALSCLLYFVCDRGKIRRNRLKGLDIRVVKALVETSRFNSWAELVHCMLISILTNMFYQVPDEPTTSIISAASFLVDQVDLIGGIDFIFIEYSLATTGEERKHLYLVLFDYVLHQINETCILTGASEYSHDESQPIATLLALADAPEAFYISIKLGVEGIGELLRRSISAALLRYPNSERLNMLLGNITEKLDAIISSFTHLDKEFLHLKQITKSNKFVDDIEGSSVQNSAGMKAKLAWTILHSLLHSDRISYRQNGYIWLGDLLIAEISESRNGTIWSNIKSLQNKIAYAGAHDFCDHSDIPLSIWLMRGLLKSKNNNIRWGFLFVLERLLMWCKFLLDESEMQKSSDTDFSPDHSDSRLEKANAVIDIMSRALSLVAINETDRINILKMCDILFSQLCLKVPHSTVMPFGEGIKQPKVLTLTDEIRNTSTSDRLPKQASCSWDELMEETDSKSGYHGSSPIHEIASMAASLLQGQAIVPMKLVARVPAALLYWPLIQLAGAATDNIALGVAVGSKGRGNIPGATSDIRATLLLLLIGKCTADPKAFQDVGGEDFFRALLEDTDSRVAYYSSAFLLKRMMTEKPEKYQHMLQKLVFKAQQSNNEKLLENPYLQMCGIFQLSNDL